MEGIRNYFESLVNISNEEWVYFASKLKKVSFPKKHLLLKAGEIENHLSFIESGMVRYYIPKMDSDFTFGFVFESNFLSAYDSFVSQKPSVYNIETLKETILWQVSHEDLQDIYNNTNIGNTIGRLASEDLFLKKSKRELSLLQETAEQRYLNLFKEQSQLLKEIPLKYIASYIGITPQALSRIRKRIY